MAQATHTKQAAGTTTTDAGDSVKVVGIVCNWCSYAGADGAGTARLKQEYELRLLRVPCTGRIDPLFIIKAFERGADGVIVSGCHPADCHYTSGNYHARRRFAVFRDLMEFIGVDPRRMTFSWVSASEGAKWRDVVNEAVANVRALGPFEAYRALAPEAPGVVDEIDAMLAAAEGSEGA